MRVGSTMAQPARHLGYGSSKWRMQPLAGADAPAVVTVRARRCPPSGRIDVKLASFNVLNYFNGDGAGGGFPTSRGANTLADFQRQRSKILAALAQMNADVVGLMEMENDGTGATSAIQDLVNGLNQAMGAGTYAFVNDGGATASPTTPTSFTAPFIYKPAAVTPLGPAAAGHGARACLSARPLAQLFITNRTARRRHALRWSSTTSSRKSQRQRGQCRPGRRPGRLQPAPQGPGHGAGAVHQQHGDAGRRRATW